LFKLFYAAIDRPYGGPLWTLSTKSRKNLALFRDMRLEGVKEKWPRARHAIRILEVLYERDPQWLYHLAEHAADVERGRKARRAEYHLWAMSPVSSAFGGNKGGWQRRDERQQRDWSRERGGTEYSGGDRRDRSSGSGYSSRNGYGDVRREDGGDGQRPQHNSSERYEQSHEPLLYGNPRNTQVRRDTEMGERQRAEEERRAQVEHELRQIQRREEEAHAERLRDVPQPTFSLRALEQSYHRQLLLARVHQVALTVLYTFLDASDQVFVHVVGSRPHTEPSHIYTGSPR